MDSPPLSNSPAMLVPALWWRWLLIVSIAGTIGGLALALGSPLFPPALDVIYTFVFGPYAAHSLSAADRVLLNVTLATGGGLQTGASTIIGFIAYYPPRRGECWAWRACVLGLALWLLPDTGLTTWYVFHGYPGLWPKIVNDLSFVAALYRHCC